MDPAQRAPMDGYDFDENMPVPHPSIYPTTTTATATSGDQLQPQQQQPSMEASAGPLCYGAAPLHLHDDNYLAPHQPQPQQQQFDTHMHQPTVQMHQHQHQHQIHHQPTMHIQQQQHHLDQQQMYQNQQQECPPESYDFYNSQYLSNTSSTSPYEADQSQGRQSCLHLGNRQHQSTSSSMDPSPQLAYHESMQYIHHEQLSSNSTSNMDCINEAQQQQQPLMEEQQPQPESTQVRHLRLMEQLKLLEEQSLSNGEMLRQLCQMQEECVIKGQDRSKAITRRMNSQERGDFKGAERFKGEVANLELILRTMGRDLREKKGRLWQRFSELFKKVSQLQQLVLFEYLPEWRLNQQISQNGTQVDNFTLDQMQQWCESITDIIWRTRNQLRAFHLFLRHIGCSQAASDEVNQLGFAINRFIETLILNTLVVEKQPPQVIKKNTRFSTTVRLLSGSKLNINLINPTLKVNIISENNARLIKMRHKELIAQSWAFLDSQPPAPQHQQSVAPVEMQHHSSHQFVTPQQQQQQPDYMVYGQDQQDQQSHMLYQQTEQEVFQLEYQQYQAVPPPPSVQQQLAQQQTAAPASSQQPPPPHHHSQNSRFNQTKILNMKEFEPSGELLNSSSLLEFNEITRQVSCQFRNMQLRTIKRLKSEKKATESVLEEKFLLLFHSQFRIAESLNASDSNFGASIGGSSASSNPGILPWMSQGDMTFHMMSFSLPVAVIVHGSQESDANATITWHNAFARPDNILYQVPERVTWPELGQVLSDKFRSCAGRGLSSEQLQYLSTKICKKKPIKQEETAVAGSSSNQDIQQQPQWVTWNQFSKEKDHMPERAFTFWEWFHSALKLTKEDLRDLWVAGRIYGFASKNDCTDLLLGSAKHIARPKGTFLLRFSETELRGITIAWVTSSSRQIDEEGCVQTGQRCSPSGSPSTVIQHVRPLGSKDLQTKKLADRLRDVKDLLYLYPDIPKDKAFMSHYTPLNNAPQPPEGYVDSELVQKFGPIQY